MSKKRIIQITSITLLVIAVILFLQIVDLRDNSSVVGGIVLILGTGGSILSIYIPSSYKLDFVSSNWSWNHSESDYSISISAKKHGLGKTPQIQTYELSVSGQYQEVGVSSFHDEKGNVTIYTNVVFNGRIILS